MDRLSISIQHEKEVTIAILHEAQPNYKAMSYQLPIAAHKNIHSCESIPKRGHTDRLVDMGQPPLWNALLTGCLEIALRIASFSLCLVPLRMAPCYSVPYDSFLRLSFLFLLTLRLLL